MFSVKLNIPAELVGSCLRWFTQVIQASRREADTQHFERFRGRSMPSESGYAFFRRAYEDLVKEETALKRANVQVNLHQQQWGDGAPSLMPVRRQRLLAIAEEKRQLNLWLQANRTWDRALRAEAASITRAFGFEFSVGELIAMRDWEEAVHNAHEQD